MSSFRFMLKLSVNKLEQLLNVFDIIIQFGFHDFYVFCHAFCCHLFVSEYWIMDHELMLRARVRRRREGATSNNTNSRGRSDHSNTAAVVRDGVLLSTAMSGRQLLIVTALCARLEFSFIIGPSL